ncbi:phage tail protein [Leptolyngbya sp. AN02str]|uniref:phage tail protein n=1 Tax=Leptolyngbya sp. AN02str TaxID=3423363 RepID=UPI003D31023C
MPEYLSSDSFSVELEGITNLIVKEASGWGVDISPSGAENAIGSGPKGKALVLSTPSQPKYGSVKLVLIPGAHQQGDDEKLWKWYSDCASKANLGEASKARELRKAMTINVYYSGTDAKVGVKYEFQNVMPSSFDVPARTATTSDLETWTFELQFERMKFSLKDP